MEIPAVYVESGQILVDGDPSDVTYDVFGLVGGVGPCSVLDFSSYPR